jgi:hypothetical protein
MHDEIISKNDEALQMRPYIFSSGVATALS